MGEGAPEERLFPFANRGHRFLLGNPHGSRTDDGVVVAVPVGRHAYLGFGFRASVFRQRPYPKVAARSLEQQGRVGILLSTQSTEGFITTTVAKEHRPDTGGAPPHNHVGGAGKGAFPQKFYSERLSPGRPQPPPKH